MISAKEARAQLNDVLNKDEEFSKFISYVVSLIKLAVAKRRNYFIFDKHANTTFNDEVLKQLKAHGFEVHLDVEYIYKYDELYGTEMPTEKEVYRVYF